MVSALVVGCGEKTAEKTGDDTTAEIVHKLLVQPDDGNQALTESIDGAKESIDIITYEIGNHDEPENMVVDALVEASGREVEVRVICNEESIWWSKGNPSTVALERLATEGVQTKKSWLDYEITHAKSMVVDGKKAFIMTGNFQDSYFATTRDFVAITTDPDEVGQIQRVFENDWNEKSSASLIDSPGNEAEALVWSPEDAREKILGVINGAEKELKLYAMILEDPGCVDALCSAARDRSVGVKILASICAEPFVQQLRDAGAEIQIGTVSGLFNHSKVIPADPGTDNGIAFVGSQNFIPNALDKYRELGILLDEVDILESIDLTFDKDWNDVGPPQ